MKFTLCVLFLAISAGSFSATAAENCIRPIDYSNHSNCDIHLVRLGLLSIVRAYKLVISCESGVIVDTEACLEGRAKDVVDNAVQEATKAGFKSRNPSKWSGWNWNHRIVWKE
jgi:hypothetical protein